MSDSGLASSRILTWLCVLAVMAGLLFLNFDIGSAWSFVLPFRAAKVTLMILVGTAIASATILFQTATGNRILTPGIMGFDALYVLIQTVLVFVLGGQTVAALHGGWLFGVEAALMLGLSGLLYGLLFAEGQRDLHRLVLAGVVAGILFRSLSEFMGRVISPNEFAFLQDRFFASFNKPDPGLLVLSALVLLVLGLAVWPRLRRWDVLALGRETAIGLGVDHVRETRRVLALVAILVCVSTALVGPVTFFGLLVANLAYVLTRSHRHAVLIPAAAMIAFICLCLGQFVLERLLGFNGSLRVIIEFAGGVTFILILIRGVRR